MLALLIIFYLWRGTMRIEGGRSGRKIVRFNGFERFVHWLTATTFVVLGITGLNITFGRALLLPLVGPEAFSAWSEWAKIAHNYLSFAFTLGVVLMFLMWIGQNFPTAADVDWFKMGGGMGKGDGHAPAYKFNAGQKLLYWFIVLGGAAMIITGFILMFPFYYGLNVGNMELAEIFHGIVGVLFIALILAHIYLGTLGMEGAFEVDGHRRRRPQLGQGAPQSLGRRGNASRAPRAARCGRPNSAHASQNKNARPRGRAFYFRRLASGCHLSRHREARSEAKGKADRKHRHARGHRDQVGEAVLGPDRARDEDGERQGQQRQQHPGAEAEAAPEPEWSEIGKGHQCGEFAAAVDLAEPHRHGVLALDRVEVAVADVVDDEDVGDQRADRQADRDRHERQRLAPMLGPSTVAACT